MTVALERDTIADSGRNLYETMKQEFDFSQISWTIRRYNSEINEARSEELVDAFLQWVSLAPRNTNQQFITMFQGPVEEAFHCFVLNTRLYRSFCEKFLGYFLHHDPVIDENVPDIASAAEYTVNSLQAEFDVSLHPDLQDWCKQFVEGSYEVACVGPGGRCYD
jgi:hypothetical protein